MWQFVNGNITYLQKNVRNKNKYLFKVDKKEPEGRVETLIEGF